MQLEKEQLKDSLCKMVDGADEKTSINIIKGKFKAKSNIPYVITFYPKFIEALENGLTNLDQRVLYKLCEYLQFGSRNAINISQMDLAEDLGVKQSQVSKSYKNLEKLGILIRDRRSLYIDNNYLVKGNLEDSKDSESYKISRNRLYKILGEHIKDQKKLEEAVHKAMSY